MSGLIAVALERFAYRPLRKRNAPPLIALISAIGASFVLAELMGLRDKLAKFVGLEVVLNDYVPGIREERRPVHARRHLGGAGDGPARPGDASAGTVRPAEPGPPRRHP